MMKKLPFFAGLLFLLLVAAGLPAAASPVISGISPATASNAGDVTVTITGTGFTSESTVWLNKPYSPDAPVHGTIVSSSPTSITCTFPLQGQTPARYNVWVNTPFTDRYGNHFAEDVGILALGFEISRGAVMTAVVTTSATPGSGNISVSSVPSLAEVYLDNAYKGLTPLTIKNVENGDHVLLVRRTGYQDWTQPAAVLGNSPAFSALLIPVPAPTTALPVATTQPVVTSSPVMPVPTTRAPLGIEAGIIATLGVALLLGKRR